MSFGEAYLTVGWAISFALLIKAMPMLPLRATPTPAWRLVASFFLTPLVWPLTVLVLFAGYDGDDGPWL